MSKFPGQVEAEKDVKEALDKLPDGFWNVPESFIEDPELREMYHVIYSNLLKENEDLDTIEALLIERAAALATQTPQIIDNSLNCGTIWLRIFERQERLMSMWLRLGRRSWTSLQRSSLML